MVSPLALFALVMGAIMAWWAALVAIELWDDRQSRLEVEEWCRKHGVEVPE